MRPAFYMSPYSHYGFCHAGWGGYSRKSPTYLDVKAQVAAVYGQPVRFSLAELCRQSSILNGSGDAARAAAETWKNPQTFLAALECMGTGADAIQSRAEAIGAAVIGWEEPDTKEAPLCQDMALTVAVLSRSTNGIYFRDRDPDYSFENLFGRDMFVDEALPTELKGAE